MSVTSVTLLGQPVEMAGDERDGYFGSFQSGAELADSVVTGVLPFVPSTGVCLDIGANLGLYAIAMARRFPELRVYAFEPVPATFEHLSRNVATNAPQVTALPYACGATDEVAVMQFVDHFAAGSHFSVEGALAKVTGENQNVDVQVKRVDTIAEELRLEHVDLIKIDVEGFELDVLHGAEQTLARDRPIVQLEFNSWTFMSHRRTLPEDVIDEICTIFPFVYAHSRHDDRLAKLSVPLDRHALLYANAVHGGVDNLLCAFSKLVPDAPHLANVWPDFVKTHDVQMVELHRQVSVLTEQAVGLTGQVAGLTEQLAGLTEQVRADEVERERAADLVAELAAHAAAQEVRLAESQVQVRALQATVSWRVTKPLRSVRTRFRSK